jgi:serine/threonine protein kinase/tetratricopeptide (TPR) repeat protein
MAVKSIDEIFWDAACIVSPDEQRAYLDRACADNVEMRRRVEELLRARPHTDFLENPAYNPGPTADLCKVNEQIEEGGSATLDHCSPNHQSPSTVVGDSLAHLPPPPPAGPPTQTFANQNSLERPDSVIGPYKLLEQIGEGGMGLVFVAEQKQPIRRKVALKVIKPGMDTRAVIARFEAERQALALMDHPNIAKVLDAGATASGRPYFVMELVKGIPITDYCDQNRLTVRKRLGLFLQVCQAVQHAHQKGIIHRDLKPSNVLVTPPSQWDANLPPPFEGGDKGGVVRIIDFGVAKAIGQQLTDKTLHTNAAQLIGTPLYMSPEQADMSGLDVDTRTDIYSLGVILYRLLVGSTPLQGRRLKEAGLAEMLKMIKEDEPPKPSTRLANCDNAAKIAAARRTEPAKLARLLSGELDWIVMKCLEKDRVRRYEAANGLARDIERYLHDEPVEACPPSRGYRLRKLARKYRMLLRVAGVFVVVLVLGAGISVWEAVQATRERNRAEQEKARAEENFKLARDAVDKYFTKVSESPSMKAHGLENLRKDLLLGAKEFYERFINQQPAERGLQADLGSAYARLGDILSMLIETEAAEANFAKAIVIFEELTRREPEDPEHQHKLTVTQQSLGHLYVDTRRPEKARTTLEQALALANNLAGTHPNEAEYQYSLASCYSELARLWNVLNRIENRQESVQNAIAIVERLVREHPDRSGRYRKLLGLSLDGLAVGYQMAGSFDKAEALNLRAIQIYQTLLSEFPREAPYQYSLADAYGRLANLYVNSGNSEKAEANVQQERTIGEKLVREHPDVNDYVLVLASSYRTLVYLQKKPQKVLGWCDKGVQTLQKVLDKEPRHLEAHRILKDLGLAHAVALAQIGDHVQAAKQADEIARQGELDPVELYNLACTYGRCLEAAGKDPKLTLSDSPKVKEQYATRAIDSLRQSIAKGFKIVALVKTDADLNSLRQREDFKKLLAELERKK